MDRKEKIEKFLASLANKENAGFALFCLKCGSTNIEESHDGSGGPVTTGSYTAGFDGQHFIKCDDCGNATTKEFYVSMNGQFQDV